MIVMILLPDSQSSCQIANPISVFRVVEQIAQLVRVGGQVVQLALVAGADVEFPPVGRYDRSPWQARHAIDLLASEISIWTPVPLHEGVAIPNIARRSEGSESTRPIQIEIVPHTSKLENCRYEIDVADVAADRDWRIRSRPKVGGDKWHVDRLLVHAALPHQTVVPTHLTMVTSEDHHSVVSHRRSLQRLEDRSDAAVEERDVSEIPRA